MLRIAPCKGLRNPGNFCLWNLKSWALESGIQIKEYGIQLTIGIPNLTSTEKNPESSTWNPESPSANPESKTILDSFTLGDI